MEMKTRLPNQDCSDNTEEEIFLSEVLTKLSSKTTNEHMETSNQREGNENF